MARCERCNKFMLFGRKSGYCENCETIVEAERQRKAEEEQKKSSQTGGSPDHVNVALDIDKKKDNLDQMSRDAVKTAKTFFDKTLDLFRTLLAKAGVKKTLSASLWKRIRPSCQMSWL